MTDIDRVARLLAGDVDPDCTVADFEAALPLLREDQVMTTTALTESTRRLAGAVDAFLEAFPRGEPPRS